MQKLVSFWENTGGDRRTEGEQRQMRERGPRESLESWYTAGLSSLWGQSSWLDLRSPCHQFPSLSSSPFSPPCGTSSSAVSPALTGLSPGTQRWVWSLRHWLFGCHLEEIQAQIHNKSVTRCKIWSSHKIMNTDRPALEKAIKPLHYTVNHINVKKTIVVLRVCSNKLISYWKTTNQKTGKFVVILKWMLPVCSKIQTLRGLTERVFVPNHVNKILFPVLNFD